MNNACQIQSLLDVHCPIVLDIPVPVVDFNGVGNVVGDLGNGLEPLDALLGVGTLPKVGWIEEKKTHSPCFVQSHEKSSRRAILG